MENKRNIKISHGTRAFIMTCREVQSKYESKNKLTQQTQMYSSKFVFPNGLGRFEKPILKSNVMVKYM